MIDNLQRYLLIPFKHLGRDFGGCDCAGLVQLFFKHELGVDLSFPESYSENWHKENPRKILEVYEEYGFRESTDIKAYDLLVLKDLNAPRHLGIVLDGNYFLHTTNTGTYVHSYRQGLWAKKLLTILRYEGPVNANSTFQRVQPIH